MHILTLFNLDFVFLCASFGRCLSSDVRDDQCHVLEQTELLKVNSFHPLSLPPPCPRPPPPCFQGYSLLPLSPYQINYTKEEMKHFAQKASKMNSRSHMSRESSQETADKDIHNGVTSSHGSRLPVTVSYQHE